MIKFETTSVWNVMRSSHNEDTSRYMSKEFMIKFETTNAWNVMQSSRAREIYFKTQDSKRVTVKESESNHEGDRQLVSLPLTSLEAGKDGSKLRPVGLSALQSTVIEGTGRGSEVRVAVEALEDEVEVEGLDFSRGSELRQDY